VFEAKLTCADRALQVVPRSTPLPSLKLRPPRSWFDGDDHPVGADGERGNEGALTDGVGFGRISVRSLNVPGGREISHRAPFVAGRKSGAAAAS